MMVCEDGDAVVLDKGKIRHEKKAVPAAYVFVDGLEVAGSAQGIIRDRKNLSEDGVIVVTLAVDGHTGEIVQDPIWRATVSWIALARCLPARLVPSPTRFLRSMPVDAANVRRRVKGIVNRVTRRDGPPGSRDRRRARGLGERR